MELLTLITTSAPAVLSFLVAHWDLVVILITALVTAFQVASAGQYQALWPLALDAVRKAAELELSGPEKRAEAVDKLLTVAPAWVKLIPRQSLEKMIEQAYQFLRGELKQEGK